jgi:hypothetical protein
MWFVSGKLLEKFFAPPIQDGDFKRSANNIEQIEHVRTVSAARQQVTELLGRFGASLGPLKSPRFSHSDFKVSGACC